jgi:tetratricopeptide (TPR) repeat protein
LDRLTRRELKKDELRTTFEHFEEYVKQRSQEILTVTILVVAVAGVAGGLKYYIDRQEAEANAELGAALKTFRAYVGAPTPGTLGADTETFPTAKEKYIKALAEFNNVIQKYRTYPRPKAVAIALYHVGVCQALLGDQAAALKTLQEASRESDPELAALAQFALAGELAKSGKLLDAVKLYQNLSDHPTLTVPRFAALMALADAYRGSQPAQARRLYAQVEKEFGSDPTVAEALKQQIASLPQ